MRRSSFASGQLPILALAFGGAGSCTLQDPAPDDLDSFEIHGTDGEPHRASDERERPGALSDGNNPLSMTAVPDRCDGDASCCMGLPVKTFPGSFAFNFDSNVCLLIDNVSILQDVGTGNVIVGGAGTQNQTIQAPNALVIFGNAGKETVQDGSATVVIGPGGGTVQVGANAHVVINSPCEIQAGMILQAGSGSKLTSPFDVPTLQSMGVTVQGFSVIEIEQHSCKSQCVPGNECAGNGECVEGSNPGDFSCQCGAGAGGPGCNLVVAEESGAPTFVRLNWVGLDAPGDVFNSSDDCVELEVQSFAQQDILVEVDFYGTLNGNAKGMTPSLSSLPLPAGQTGIIGRCLRDFEGAGGHDDLLQLAFSARMNARATVLAGLDGSGGRLDRIFAPTVSFHVDPDPQLFIPYRAVIYDDKARRETFSGGDYSGILGFTVPGGGIYIPHTHPDNLYDEGGPNTPEPPPPPP